jgi:hypothetical protein
MCRPITLLSLSSSPLSLYLLYYTSSLLLYYSLSFFIILVFLLYILLKLKEVYFKLSIYNISRGACTRRAEKVLKEI